MVRPARLNDFSQIKYIKDTLALDVAEISTKEYRFKVQKEGFLLKSPTTEESFQNDLHKIFLIGEQDDVCVGYIRVDEIPEISRDTGIFWLRPELEESYFTLPHACIGGLGILQEGRGIGLAKELLRQTEEKVKAKETSYIFSFVVLSPVTNTASILFHEKNGFERAATTFPRKLFEMEGYQSILYCKKI